MLLQCLRKHLSASAPVLEALFPPAGRMPSLQPANRCRDTALMRRLPQIPVRHFPTPASLGRSSSCHTAGTPDGTSLAESGPVVS